LLFAAIGVMGALRNSIRVMFDLAEVRQNPLRAKVRQLLGFMIVCLAMLVSAASSVLVHSIGSLAEGWFGGSNALTLRLATALLGVLVDTAIIVGLITLVGGARPRRRELLLGALFTGAVAGGLRWVGTSAIVGASARNALLAPFAVIITLLVLINFLARLLLLTCAWMHNPPGAALPPQVGA
ncbi:MAG: YihY/virulence factor BrkB family protein, partial [Promicromonosporaceae bacterium]|nr:YihY/virulence factor BrkB family protein [Promicromonosporaceae bacterium]